MKTLSFLIILIGFSFIPVSISYSQNNLTVIKVNGTIVIQESNMELQQGTVFSENDDIEFKTTNARAAVISPGKGRFILMPGNKNITSNLLPAMANISSRAGALINFIDLQNHFKGNYLILNKTAIKISSDNFPMDDRNLFYIRYQYKGEPINKKLAFKADTLYIDKKELFTVDGKTIPVSDTKEVTLFYMETGNKSSLINAFTLVTPDNEELKNEIQIILSTLKDKPYKDKVNEVVSYLNEYYGKPDEDNVKEWLEENFGLK